MDFEIILDEETELILDLRARLVPVFIRAWNGIGRGGHVLPGLAGDIALPVNPIARVRRSNGAIERIQERADIVAGGRQKVRQLRGPATKVGGGKELRCESGARIPDSCGDIGGPL